MTRAFFRIAIRPAVLFWLVWVGTILFIPMNSKTSISLILIIGPGLTGMILGQVTRDIQNRLFSWNLPGIRGRLAWEYGLTCLVFSGFFVVTVPVDLSWPLKWVTSIMFFSLGSILKTAQYTFFELKWSSSLLALVLIFFSGLYYDIFFFWIGENRLFFCILGIALSVFAFSRIFTRSMHQKTLFELTYPIVSSINSVAMREFQRRKMVEHQPDEDLGFPENFHGNTSLRAFLPAIVFESTQGIPPGKFLRNIFLASILVALMMGYIFGDHNMNHIILIVALVMCFQFPLMFREKLLHPMSRLKMFRMNYAAKWLEDCMYIFLPIFLIYLIGLLPWPDLHFRDITLIFRGSPQLLHTGVLCLVFAPLVQYQRRRFGLSLPGFILSISVASLVIILLLNLHAQLQMSQTYLIISNSLYVLIGQSVYYYLYKKHALSGDINLDCS